MKQPFARRSLVVAISLLAGRLGAQAAPLYDVPVPPHDSFTIASRTLGETRLINVYVPESYRASATTRFPVLYMPDGGTDEDFPHVVHTVDSLVAARAIRSVIVVGIPNTERRRDLTGPTRIKSDSAVAPHVGGSAPFRRFIRDEVLPEIERRYRTTRERSIVGESLAGLFIVETFLTEPALFNHYVAFDPSMWWNAGALVDSSSALLSAFDAAPRTLYLANSADDIDARTSQLASRIRAAARPGLTLTYVPRSDLKHSTIFRALEGPALASALR